MYDNSSRPTGHRGRHVDRAATDSGTGPMVAANRVPSGGGRMSIVGNLRLRRIGGVGLTMPNPPGPRGSTRVPIHDGRRVTHLLTGSLLFSSFSAWAGVVATGDG